MPNDAPTPPEPPRADAAARLAWIGLVAGPLLALAAYGLLPASFVDAGGTERALDGGARGAAALGVWMAVWWMTEAVPLQATSLLPIVLLPALDVASLADAAAPYASPVIYLFLGGFLLAASMQRWRLDRRLALWTLCAIGGGPARTVGGFMLATATLSSCVSNTATAVMMLPVATSVLRGLGEAGLGEEDGRRLRRGLLLGIAYAASIGGLGTVIGSPPNGLLVQFAADELGRTITFASWLRVGVPLVLVLLPVTWWLLTRVLHPLPRAELPGAREALRRELAALGPMNAGERWTLVVFGAAVACWLTRPWLLGEVGARVGDAGIAVAAGLALFVLPVEPRRRVFALDWGAARSLPFGVLILFGGGLSLAAAVGAHGLDAYLGSHARALAAWPDWALVAGVTAGMVFLTEVTSNTASAAALVPVLAALAPGLGVEPLELALPATLAASCAFMLPVATPPNAVVFASGDLEMRDMVRAGFWLNLVAIAVLATLVPRVLLRLLGV